MISSLKRLSHINWFVFAFMAVLMVVGVFFVYSANSIRDSVKLQTLYIAHAQLAAAGILIGFATSLVDYRRLLRFSWVFYAGANLLLVAVILFGTSRLGAKRWVFGIQPSELAKIATIMVLAAFLGREDARRDIWDFAAACLITFVPMGLILMQPDLGTTLVFLPILAVMLFISGTAPKVLLSCVLAGIVSVSVVLGAVVLREKPDTAPAVKKAAAVVTSVFSDYQVGRLLDFVYPERDPINKGWNRRQSQIAIGSGGVWGKGFLKGDQNILGYLPQQVSANDFIFSVLAEEKGFAGSVFVLLCFTGLVISMLAVAAVCQDGSGRLLCTGVSALVFCHAFINVGMTVGLLPVTGLPLPFLSYGRTFMLAVTFAMGLVQSVSVHSARREISEIET